VSEKYVVAGDNVTLRCSVEYLGPETPYFEWTDDNHNTIYESLEEWTEPNNDSDTVASVRVSELEIIVPDGAEYFPPYTCSVKFYWHHTNTGRYYSYRYGYYNWYYSFANIYTAYNWTSPEVKVSCK